MAVVAATIAGLGGLGIYAVHEQNESAARHLLNLPTCPDLSIARGHLAYPNQPDTSGIPATYDLSNNECTVGGQLAELSGGIG